MSRAYSSFLGSISQHVTLTNWDGRPSPALESAITLAERIMRKIDNVFSG